MERLSYDLVEKILGSLPRKNVEAVAEAVEGCRRLEHWDAAAKDQLENRLLLDVTVSVQQPITNDKNSDPRIDISCRVILHRGGYRAWNFTQWRYAWIRNVYIKTSLYTGRPNDPYTGNADQALRSLSLPVEPSARGSLLYYHGPQFDDNGNDNKLWAGLQVVDLSWKFLQAAQKGFSNVTIHRSKHISCEAFEKFVVDHICQGAVLESLQCLGDCTKSRNILAVVARLFRERRGRPLKLKLHCVHFKQAEVELIIDNWLQSDGAFEEKTISWCGTDGHAINRVKYKQFVRTYSCGYLAHPTRRSSLKITRGTIQVKQFHPWHTPVDFKWLDSVINDWKKGDGRSLRGREYFSFVFNAEEDWKKLLKKYGQTMDAYGHRLSVPHPSDTAWLEVTKDGELCNALVMIGPFADEKISPDDDDHSEVPVD